MLKDGGRGEREKERDGFNIISRSEYLNFHTQPRHNVEGRILAAHHLWWGGVISPLIPGTVLIFINITASHL